MENIMIQIEKIEELNKMKSISDTDQTKLVQSNLQVIQNQVVNETIVITSKQPVTSIVAMLMSSAKSKNK